MHRYSARVCIKQYRVRAGTTSTLIIFHPHKFSGNMCVHQHFGDWYYGCGHFFGVRYSGEVRDCNQPDCRTSKIHMHRIGGSDTAECYCKEMIYENRIIENYVDEAKCPHCEEPSIQARLRQSQSQGW
ncbi:hypothetical protein FIBSPDRAFT_229627 [Athelia psychrophila]|uniref:Uncharacterized protein n=1 Tax=Athelia psychrophila TaxID=1759441 RepID=A0A165YS73_9AGAM|nr:hypothetical protein FIBSPDRAFT_229627 [Fibularhizoctonia sp. CBS 109695]